MSNNRNNNFLSLYKMPLFRGLFLYFPPEIEEYVIAIIISYCIYEIYRVYCRHRKKDLAKVVFDNISLTPVKNITVRSSLYKKRNLLKGVVALYCKNDLLGSSMVDYDDCEDQHACNEIPLYLIAYRSRSLMKIHPIASFTAE
jgi:hypothetical protein